MFQIRKYVCVCIIRIPSVPVNYFPELFRDAVAKTTTELLLTVQDI